MNKKNVLIIFLVSFLIMNINCSQKMKVDLIVHNAVVYTVDNDFAKAESFAVKDGKFVEIGTNEHILNSYTSKNIFDAKGKFIYPGFYDAHCHFYGYAQSLQYANLVGTKSFDEVVERIIKHQQEFSSEWILGRGWDQNDWEIKEFPTNEKINELFPDIPVVLKRVDGHAVIANKKALDIAGININSSFVGGEVVLINNQLSGVLIDKAAEFLETFIPENSNKQKTVNLLQAQKNCFAVGLTSVADAGLEKNIVLLIDSLQKKGDLKMRIYAMLSATNENFEYFVKKGIYKTDYLNVRSIKLYADGALGSRGAALIKPYSDDAENFGLIVISQDTFNYWCKNAFENNYQVNTHAIGDSANRIVLKTYAKFLKQKNDRRWRIEHSQVIDKNDFDLFGQYSIIPSIQTTHATSDMYWAENRLGKERIKNAYAYKKLLSQNGWIPNGSDFPVEDINPLYGFYAGVSRKDFNDYPKNGFQKENALTREQALKAMTIWAAKSCFEENEKGSIEPNKFADFVVLDNDIMNVQENNIFTTKVLTTFSNGEIVYESKN